VVQSTTAELPPAPPALVNTMPLPAVVKGKHRGKGNRWETEP